MEEIHFTSDITLESFKNQNWSIGDSYNVEFFPGKLVPVYLFDTNSDLTETIETMSQDQIIFANFEYVAPRFKAPPICLYSFCCTSGVYLIKQADFTPNEQIKNFLTGKQFIGCKIGDIFHRFQKLFGRNFYINYNNVIKNQIPSEDSHDLKDIFLKYAGTPSADFDTHPSKIDKKILTKEQVLTCGYIVYALSLSYPNLPNQNTEKPTKSREKKDEYTIIFDKGFLPSTVPKKARIGCTYKIEFYPEEFIEVKFINSNSDLTQYIELMSKDPVIFANFESSTISNNPIPINVFSFCCSSGVFVFQSTTPKGNPQLGEFLSKKKGQKFYTFGISALKAKLKKMFGKKLKTDIDDIYNSRVQKPQPPKLYNLVEKYGGKPLVDRDVLKKAKAKKWSQKVLSIEHLLRAVYVSYGLSHCFQNLPDVITNIMTVNDDDNNENDEIELDENDDQIADQTEGQIVDYGQISFTEEVPLSSYKTTNWTLGATAEIEFFEGTFSKVYLLDAVKDFQRFIPEISKDSDVIFIDFEYVPLYRKDAAPVCLFQFCNSSGSAFLFRQRMKKRNEVLKKFLSKENGLKFVAKGIPGDMTRLKLFFGNDFDINIEDVEVTRLMPYNESCNFEKMVNKFAGESTAKFKDKRISCSNWNANNLKKIQVIYSAFDVVALFRCYSNFRPIAMSLFKQPNTPIFDPKKNLAEYAVTLKKFNSENLNDSEKVNEFWNLNPNLVLNLIGVDFDLLNFVVCQCLSSVKGNGIRCRICNNMNTCVFRNLLKHCQTDHYVKSGNNKVGDFKVLFMNYLNFTGKIRLSDLTCVLCNGQSFQSENDLCQHCWNKHAAYVIELYPLPKNKKSKKKKSKSEMKEKSESDDGDDNVKDEKIKPIKKNTKKVPSSKAKSDRKQKSESDDDENYDEDVKDEKVKSDKKNTKKDPSSKARSEKKQKSESDDDENEGNSKPTKKNTTENVSSKTKSGKKQKSESDDDDDEIEIEDKDEEEEDEIEIEDKDENDDVDIFDDDNDDDDVDINNEEDGDDDDDVFIY